MISCQQAVRQLWEYLEREIPTEDAVEIERHLGLCRRCCGEAEFASLLRDFLVARAAPTIPDEVQTRLEGFLSEIEIGNRGE